MYDVIIVGAGPAGLSAALDAHYLKLNTLVLEAEKAGGALSQTYPWKKVDSCLGFYEKKGMEIADAIVGHARKAGIRIREWERVESVTKGDEFFTVKTSKAEHRSRIVILATGIRAIPRKLGVPGEGLEGVLYSVDKPSGFRGKHVLVVGGGDSAADTALGLDEAGAHVWLAHRRDELRATAENVENLKKSGVKMLWSHEVREFAGSGKLEKAHVVDKKTGKVSVLGVDAAVVCIGSMPSREYLANMGVKMENGLVPVGKDCMTDIKGLFAVGDIVSSLKRIPQALATGEKAAFAAYKLVKNPYWK